MSSAKANEMTIRAAEIAEAHITGQETPSFDPHKKADAENIGWMSGDQFTISETPVAPMGATIGKPIQGTKQEQILNSAKANEKTIRAAEIAEAHITGQETPSFDPHKKADAENIGFMSGDQFTISETPVAFMGATIGAN